MEPIAQREMTEALLQEQFRTRARIIVADAMAACHEPGISRRTLSRVGAQMGVRIVLNGRHGGLWERGQA